MLVYPQGHELGKGTFSRVYATTDPETGRLLAIKYARDTASADLLAREAEVMLKLSTCSSVPKLVCVLQAPVGIVMERVGKTLLDLQRELQRFSVKTTAMLAIEAISALEALHSFGYIHRDIKPDNLCISRHRSNHSLYLIDLGLSALYMANGMHQTYSEQARFQGAPCFCSLASLQGVRPSRRDDLEALGYVLVYLQKGYLPWVDGTVTNIVSISEKRQQYPLRKLCQGLESEFMQFITDSQALAFSETPDYAYFRCIFANLLNRLGHKLDWNYDWTRGLKVVKTCSFRTLKANNAFERRPSLPVAQCDCGEQASNEALTPVASVIQLPSFQFSRLRSRQNTEKREFKAVRPPAS